MLSIIWNITNHCPWNCPFCVIDAGIDCQRAELTYSEKLTVIEHLRGIDCRVDLSGGEVMFNRKEHLPLIAYLSCVIGRERLGISCSGSYIGDSEAVFLSRYVANVEMTMDAHPEWDFPHRPRGYHVTAGKAADFLTAEGIRVGMQTVVTRDHMLNPKLFDDLHGWLCEHRISEWSLLRYFPSGRGVNYPELALSDAENLALVMRARRLCSRTNSPSLDVHYLMPGTEKDNHCRCVRKSIGILPNGDVTSCFWGLDGSGDIKEKRFYLGNLLEAPLYRILRGINAIYWNGYFGGCPLETNGD